MRQPVRSAPVIRVCQDGSLELRPPEICPADVRYTEVCPVKLRIDKFRPAELRPLAVRPAEVRKFNIYIMTPYVSGTRALPKLEGVIVARRSNYLIE